MEEKKIINKNNKINNNQIFNRICKLILIFIMLIFKREYSSNNKLAKIDIYFII